MEETDWVKSYIEASEKRMELRIAAVEKLLGQEVKYLRELFEQRATAADEALRVAKVGLNEMRGMAVDQQAAFLTKSEYSGRQDLLASRLNAIDKDITAINARNSAVQTMIKAGTAVIGLAISLGLLVLSYHKIT